MAALIWRVDLRRFASGSEPLLQAKIIYNSFFVETNQ